MKTILLNILLAYIFIFSVPVFGSSESCLNGDLTEYDFFRDGISSFSIEINDSCIRQLIGEETVVLEVPLDDLAESREVSGIVTNGVNEIGRLTLYSFKSNEHRATLEMLLMKNNAEKITEISSNGVTYVKAEHQNGDIKIAPDSDPAFFVSCSGGMEMPKVCSFRVIVSSNNIQYRYVLSGLESISGVDWMAFYVGVEEFVGAILIN